MGCGAHFEGESSSWRFLGRAEGKQMCVSAPLISGQQAAGPVEKPCWSSAVPQGLDGTTQNRCCSVKSIRLLFRGEEIGGIA